LSPVFTVVSSDCVSWLALAAASEMLSSALAMRFWLSSPSSVLMRSVAVST